MGGFGFVIILAVLIIAITIGLVGHYREKQRTEELLATADRMGFSFSPEAEPSLLGTLSHFHLFSQGRGRKIRNVMRKRLASVEVAIFDYQYTTGSGRHSSTHYQTVVLFESERLQLPDFTLRPEDVFHKIGGFFGYQDIDFEANPAFSDTYLLQGSDEAQIRAVFTDEVLSYYVQHWRACTEASGRQLVYYRNHQRETSARMQNFFDRGLSVLGLFLPQDETRDELDDVLDGLDDVFDDLGLLGLDLDQPDRAG